MSILSLVKLGDAAFQVPAHLCLQRLDLLVLRAQVAFHGRLDPPLQASMRKLSGRWTDGSP